MSDFINQCRAEWKRLGVADSLAEEMAADLASDLREAEAEGISADQLLGPSASDPRSFAFAWAAERGIIPAPTGQEKVRRSPLALVTFTALGATALIVAALLLLTGQPKVTLTTSGPLGPRHQVQASAAAPIEWILLFLAIAAVGFAAWLWSRWRRLGPPATA